jgi:hypothetical protein
MKRSSSSRFPSRESQREAAAREPVARESLRHAASADGLISSGEPRASERSERVRFEVVARHDHDRQHWPRRHGSAQELREERVFGRSDSGDDEDEGASQQRLKMARRRRALQRVRATTLLFVLPTVAFSLVLMTLAHVVFGDWRRYNAEADIARAQLLALQEQLDNGKRRLAVLRSDKGREQLLVEHGYIKPGDRILLFPTEPGQDVPSPLSTNDLAPRRAAIRDESAGSAWQRASRSLSDWIGSLRSQPARPATFPAPSDGVETPPASSSS